MATSNDHKILGLLKGNAEDCNKGLRYIYREYFNLIRNLVLQNNGSEDDAHDIFQESVIVFYEKVRAGNFIQTASIKTYIYAVCRNKWIDQLRRKKAETKFKESITVEHTITEPLPVIVSAEKTDLLAGLMDQLKADCRRLLRMAIFDNIPVQKLYLEMGYKNEQIVRNKKTRCLKALRELVKAKATIRNLLKHE